MSLREERNGRDELRMEEESREQEDLSSQPSWSAESQRRKVEGSRRHEGLQIKVLPNENS